MDHTCLLCRAIYFPTAPFYIIIIKFITEKEIEIGKFLWNLRKNY